MNFNEYQTRALESKQCLDKIPPAVLWALGLGGETGGVLEKVKKIFRDKDGEYGMGDQNVIKRELGDVLWYLVALGDSMGISLQEIAVANLSKLRDRSERGVVQGDGE